MPNSSKIKFMGRDMTFTPGKEGSLTYQEKLGEAPDFGVMKNYQKRAKEVPSPEIEKEKLQKILGKGDIYRAAMEEMESKKKKQNPSVGSTRG